MDIGQMYDGIQIDYIIIIIIIIIIFIIIALGSPEGIAIESGAYS